MKCSLIKLFGLSWLSIVLGSSAYAEDIDIFAGSSDTGTAAKPNVVFVLDNTANWAREGQKWPDDDGEQGASEVRAIRTVLDSMVDKINVGLMLYETVDESNTAGYVRIDLQELTRTYYDDFVYPTLTTIYNALNDDAEKRNAANTYAPLMEDFYNYLKGDDQSNSGNGTPTLLADGDGYASQWDEFESPLTSDGVCADTYMIYIGNNKNGNVAGDETANTNALKAAYVDAGKTAPDALAGESGTPLAIPEFTIKQTFEEVCEGGADPYTFQSAACYSNKDNGTGSIASCTTAECAGLADGCECTTPLAPHTDCDPTASPASKQTFRFEVDVPASLGSCETIVNETAELTGEDDLTGGADYNMDDWTKFLFNEGVPFSFSADLDNDGTDEDYDERVKVTSYVIDVFNAQQEAELSGVWFGAAESGGGKYFQAKSAAEIEAALEITLGDIVAKASSFAAVTLPLSTTNRSQVENEVYIGMFRPEQGKDPRWYGNLKRYQLARFSGRVGLADINYEEAINPGTGFPRECAKSFWTEDSSDYWEDLAVSPSVESECSNLTLSDPNEVYSDLPDGPFVEKGGAGQQIRKLASGANRTLYTSDPNDLVLLSSIDPNDVGGPTVYSFITGDTAGVGEAGSDTGLDRPSVHGDVVHSRPLSVRYDDDTVFIYYGSNDGFFRGVDTSDGTEKWAFIAPEHHEKMERLYLDEPKIKFEGVLVDPNDPEAERKDYFFDGPTGFHVQYDDPNDPASEDVGDLEYAYIYPTMRRGGRMIYGFDVTDPNDPDLMWRQGCDENDSCGAGFEDIGQTWSTPQGVFVPGYPASGDPDPVLIFGGGYDECLDEDQATYPTGCSSADGKGVYIVDALTGQLIEKFNTDAPVLTDIAIVDLDADGVLEFAYAGDAKGNLYRVRFADYIQNMAALAAVPVGGIQDRGEPDSLVTGVEPWIIEKIAHVPSSSLRFYNSPTASELPTLGDIAVTIGTGDRERPLESNYPYASDVQNRFYALLDTPYEDYAAEQADAMWTRDDLNMEDPNDFYEVGSADGEQLRNYRGWYMDLPNQGEQTANPSVVGAGKVFFNTFQPGGAPGSICSSPIGLGRAYAIDLFAPELQVTEDTIAGGGIPIPPIIVTVEVPPGCSEGDCDGWTPDQCVGDDCETETRTGIIGLDGFEFDQLDPVIDPQIQRVYFTEDIERSNP